MIEYDINRNDDTIEVQVALVCTYLVWGQGPDPDFHLFCLFEIFLLQHCCRQFLGDHHDRRNQHGIIDCVYVDCVLYACISEIQLVALVCEVKVRTCMCLVASSSVIVVHWRRSTLATYPR